MFTLLDSTVSKRSTWTWIDFTKGGYKPKTSISQSLKMARVELVETWAILVEVVHMTGHSG